MENEEKVLKLIYYDEKNPAALSSAVKLYKAAKTVIPSITLEKVKEWLSGELTYTLHKPVKRNFVRNKIEVEKIDQQWEADLVDMQEFSRQNKSYKYILTVIDCLSKFAWVEPIKNKKPESVITAFERIFKSQRIPTYIRTDQGKEFVNQKFQKFLKSFNVKHFTSKNKTIKCAIVERFNRTFKSKMFKYFTSQGTKKYIDILDNLVTSYNSS